MDRVAGSGEEMLMRPYGRGEEMLMRPYGGGDADETLLLIAPIFSLK